jgi:tetratricopeptide (TPR) repeat protein
MAKRPRGTGHHTAKFSCKRIYSKAGNAYRSAGELEGAYSNWCDAATSYVLASKQDSALFCARKCIEKGTGIKDSEANLAIAHRQIADTLNSRGVYLEALNHAKECTVLNPKDPFGYDAMAVALNGLRRFAEAINAEQQAIALSDGKYGWMHFNLGSAYFDQENWSFALQSFAKAAELSHDDAASAYNAALCNQRLGYFLDAVRWYQEYLRRRPNADDRDQVMELIRRYKALAR